jgi:hypothetical protein
MATIDQSVQELARQMAELFAAEAYATDPAAISTEFFADGLATGLTLALLVGTTRKADDPATAADVARLEELWPALHDIAGIRRG